MLPVVDQRLARASLIEDLEAKRGTTVLCYFTSTRPNLDVPMAMDAIPVIYRHLQAMTPEQLSGGIDLILHTNGGEGVVPWRLLSLLRTFAPKINVLVPVRAFSSGTLLALGADQVVMHAMGMLGPIDPTVHSWFNPPDPQMPTRRLGISVEDVASFFDFLHEDAGLTRGVDGHQSLASLLQHVHPLALGAVKRSTLQSRLLGTRLLSLGGMKLEPDLDQVVERLASQLYSHGHPISAAEARGELGLTHVVDAPRDVAPLLWSLYESYAVGMQLEDAFDAIELMSGGKAMPLPEPESVSRLQSTLGPIVAVAVESRARSDVVELTFDAVMVRNWVGTVSTDLTLVNASWTRRA